MKELETESAGSRLEVTSSLRAVAIEFELVPWRDAQTPEEGTVDVTTAGE